jgi:hypothetical protein
MEWSWVNEYKELYSFLSPVCTGFSLQMIQTDSNAEASLPSKLLNLREAQKKW